MKLSKPVKDNKKLIKDVAVKIQDLVYDYAFKEIMDIVNTAYTGQDEFENATKSDNIAIILKNIKQGNITISSSGNFYVRRGNATISRALKQLGGEWNPKRKQYKLDLKKYPDINQAWTVKKEEANNRLKKVDTVLIDKEQNIDLSPLFKLPEAQVDALVRDFAKNVNIVIPKAEDRNLGIVVKVDENVIKQFTDEYIENTELPIKNMAKRSIKRMRKEILPKIMEEGYTTESLTEMLEKEYGMTRRHAKFVAEQEARIVKSKIIKDRALSLGHNAYIWQTAHDKRVRKLHQELNGKKYYFNAPPIIDEYGNRGNPGETFGCRCIARIILDE